MPAANVFKRATRGFSFAAICGLTASPAAHADGRLIVTGGATQLEGAAGGGIVPWAVLAGYGTGDENGGTAHFTHVNTADYTLNVLGAVYTINNRVELSFARQEFDLGTLGTQLDAAGDTLRQNIFGAKVRVLGDVIYTPYPQVSLGVQYKKNLDFGLPQLVGARDDDGLDFYLAASKVFLAGLAGRNLLLNGTVRVTKANQLGLLGFGGDQGDSYETVVEASAALLLNRNTAIGIEYRQKPDNLGFAEEEDWHDLFFAYFPNKHVALVVAYAGLGSIAGIDNQNGLYLNVQASF